MIGLDREIRYLHRDPQLLLLQELLWRLQPEGETTIYMEKVPRTNEIRKFMTCYLYSPSTSWGPSFCREL